MQQPTWIARANNHYFHDRTHHGDRLTRGSAETALLFDRRHQHDALGPRAAALPCRYGTSHVTHPFSYVQSLYAFAQI